MSNQPFISNYSLTTSKNCFGCTKKRIQVQTVDGKTFSIAAANKVKLPRYIRGIFWSKVVLADKSTLYVNKKSLAKRTKLSLTYVKSSLCKNKDFDSLMRTLSKVDDVRAVLEKDEPYYSPKHDAIQIVKKMEKKKEKYLAKAATEGSFVNEWKNGRTLFVIVNPETGHTDFYVSLHKVLGAGGFKTVFALMDYESAKASYALSIQNADPKEPKNINLTKKGLDFVAHLDDSKRVLKPIFYIEKGVNRDESGEFLSNDDKAKVYLATKRYSGTFNDIANSDKIPFKDKLELFSHILEGVVEMHDQNILHRDLKFENVLYKKTSNGYKIKINDFDLCCFFNDGKSLNGRAGTYNHMAPEILGKKKLQDPAKADCWSLGIMLYMLSESDPAFIHGLRKLSSKEKQVDQILTGIKTLTFKKLPPDSPLIPVIQGLLNPDPSFRISSKQALDQIRNYLSDLN